MAKEKWSIKPRILTFGIIKRLVALAFSFVFRSNEALLRISTNSLHTHNTNRSLRGRQTAMATAETEFEADVATKQTRSSSPSLTSEQTARMKRASLKNVIVISFSFMLLFTAFQSMANLQSSLNREQGLGVSSLSTIYAALVVSCMFVPTLLIKKLTVKWAMVVSMFCYSAYIAAQFYPTFYTLIPGAVILGLGAAPMWSAKCTYLSQLGNYYGQLSGCPTEPIIVKFFGIFFLFFQSASIWGNLISSAVLSIGRNDTVTDQNSNTTQLVDLATCGVNFCPLPAATSDEETPQQTNNFSTTKTQLYILAGVFLACSILSAVIISFLVDPLSRFGENDRSCKKTGQELSGLNLLVATFRHLRKTNQLLLIPLTFWSGVEQGFFGADFTAGFVSCAFGVHNVGYVLITYGVCDALCSLCFGSLIKYVGRVSIFLAGSLLNLIVIIVLHVWDINREQFYVVFILAGLWGTADAVWQTQINALYGVLFENDEEAAFSNYRLWESLGFILAYILQTQCCIYAKLWVLLGILILGMICYMVLEVLEATKKSNRVHNLSC